LTVALLVAEELLSRLSGCGNQCCCFYFFFTVLQQGRKMVGG
jgi:hypothetical protein